MASYLVIPITGGTVATSDTNEVVVPIDSIMFAHQGIAGAPQTTPTVNTTIVLNDGLLTELQFTHTAAAAGFNVLDAINGAIAGKPAGGRCVVGGIPATVSATGQAVTFVQFSQMAIT
ncbi:MAG: hypothetical protein H8E55_44295 [Pelagibacterales bacterium]|nr:hypothetical protein [Pelagibacterales bacterium]